MNKIGSVFALSLFLLTSCSEIYGFSYQELLFDFNFKHNLKVIDIVNYSSFKTKKDYKMIISLDESKSEVYYYFDFFFFKKDPVQFKEWPTNYSFREINDYIETSIHTITGLEAYECISLNLDYEIKLFNDQRIDLNGNYYHINFNYAGSSYVVYETENGLKHKNEEEVINGI